MDEQHNELMKYVLDEPEEAAREIACLRQDAANQLCRADVWALLTVAFAIGFVIGALAL